MLAVQNIKLSSFSNLIVPVDVKQSIENLVERIKINITNADKKPIIHLVSVVKNTNDYDLNRYMLLLNKHKFFFEENGFVTTAEFVKISEGNEKISEVIIDYASRLETTLLIDVSLLKRMDTTKNDLLETNSSIIFI